MIIAFMGGFLVAQQVGTVAPQIGAVENDPYANYHQKWSPMMQKLFQQVKNDGETITYYVGAEVGSPYEYEDFKLGKVYYSNDYLGQFYYRYNIFSNEIEVKKTLLEEEVHKALIPDEKVALVLASENEYRYLSFKTAKNEADKGYLKRILKGSHYKLYKRTVVKYTEAKPAANSMVNPIPSKFTQFAEYYLQQDEGTIIEVPLKKNKFLKHFPSVISEDLKSYLKVVQVDLTNENDLIKTITYIDGRSSNGTQ
jgi:hypothetical protein